MKKWQVLLLSLLMMLLLGACGSKEQVSGESEVDFFSLQKTGEMERSYATMFSVEEYDKYELITIVDGGRFLLVPEGAQIPSNLPENVCVLEQPLDCIYLVSTSVMDMVRELDGLDAIRMTGTKERDWYVEEAREALSKGDMVYAGKYSAPDYEIIVSEGCDLAIENSMIYHNPEVKEKLEEMGIPVLVEMSSYETHPLGRLEWIKLYGLLLGKEESATEYYQNQLDRIEPIMEREKTDKKVAFFYVASNGSVVVRKPNDYIAQMIALSGGHYVLDDILEEEENALSSMNMQMEDFYAAAWDADILIYNSSVDGELDSIDALLDKSSLFANFEAVKAGSVYTTSKNFFQQSTGIAEFMEDLNLVIHNESGNYTFLKKLGE